MRYWDGYAWTEHVAPAPAGDAYDGAEPDAAESDPPAADGVDAAVTAPEATEPIAARARSRPRSSLIVLTGLLAVVGGLVVVLLFVLPSSDEDVSEPAESSVVSRNCRGAAESITGDDFAATGPADLVPLFNACTTREEWAAVTAEFPQLAGDKPVRWARRQCRLVAELRTSSLCLALDRAPSA